MTLYEQLMVEADEEFPQLNRGPKSRDVGNSWSSKVIGVAMSKGLVIPNHLPIEKGTQFQARFNPNDKTLTIRFVEVSPSPVGGWTEHE